MTLGIVLPVGSGDVQQLEGTHFARVGQVRSATEVDEFPLAVEAEGRILPQVLVDVFHLVVLAQVLDQGPARVGRFLEALERLAFLDDSPHFLLDARQILFADGRRRVDVVVETVLQGRSEGELSAREQPHDGPGHDVSGAVAQHFESLRVLIGQDLKVHFAGRQFTFEIHDRSVDPSSDGRLGQPLADAFGHVARPGSFRDLLD